MFEDVNIINGDSVSKTLSQDVPNIIRHGTPGDYSVVMTEQATEKWMFASSTPPPQFCMLLYGSDGTGKSGIVLSYPLVDDELMLVVDLDGGCGPLLSKYHSAKLKNIVVVNPLSYVKNAENGDVFVDYKLTLEKIKSAILYVQRHHQDKKFKAVCFDGMSTLLKIAEYQMRSEKNVTPDGGMGQRYWIIRGKIFTEIIEQIKALPIDKFFIAHENFMMPDETSKKVSLVVAKANQMMFQKVRCERVDDGESIVFTATVDKSKYNASLEGRSIDFLKVDKKSGALNWSGESVLERFRE